MIGDGYMVICGAPETQPKHALLITDFACSIIDATSKINDPSTNKPLEIRVGECYSNPIAMTLTLTCIDYVIGDGKIFQLPLLEFRGSNFNNLMIF